MISSGFTGDGDDDDGDLDVHFVSYTILLMLLPRFFSLISAIDPFFNKCYVSFESCHGIDCQCSSKSSGFIVLNFLRYFF